MAHLWPYYDPECLHCGNYDNGVMTPKDDANLDELSQTALAHALWSSIEYKEGLYR